MTYITNNHPLFRDGIAIDKDNRGWYACVNLINYYLPFPPDYHPEWYTKKRWEPAPHEKYWFVRCTGEIDKDEFSPGYHWDENRKKLGNIFQTEQEAIIARDKIKELLSSL